MKKYLFPHNTASRFPTREVTVGQVKIGGGNPIRIQSMITSNTNDIESCVEQIMKLSDCGCEIARITVQGNKEAKSCEQIKNRLLQLGYTIPLVADIHFYPPAAMTVADFVEKIRINPGNYLDRRATFREVAHTEESYQEVLAKIEEGFSPLVEKCKKLHRALRIGTNHGSLSDRIMTKYGDTPMGMVISAFEYAEVCRKYDFHNFVFSMKSSNPIVMIDAYRLLVEEMQKKGWDYPLHLGVTEAGEGEDGRIKSSVGIGSLLLDGIGDTIRVSLTEDPWKEIDPCKRLITFAEAYKADDNKLQLSLPFEKREIFPQFPKKGSVIIACKEKDLIDGKLESTFSEREDLYPDAILLQAYSPQLFSLLSPLMEKGLQVLIEKRIDQEKSLIYRLKKDGSLDTHQSVGLKIVSSASSIEIERYKPDFLIFSPSSNRIAETRALQAGLQDKIPLILSFSYEVSKDDLLIHASAEYGSLFCDNLAQGMLLESYLPLAENYALSLSILQACRIRLFKTDFISCPSCGRTLFDLQEVTERIKAKTDHLPGVKIAIMGCIVNGPGEMADADFGYVGSKPGKVDLYIGKKCVERNIDFAEADERLIDLIKSEGKWVEPKSLIEV